MTPNTRNLIGFTSMLAFMAFWGWRESQEHIACIQSGGDVVLGWFQDGCAERSQQ